MNKILDNRCLRVEAMFLNPVEVVAKIREKHVRGRGYKVKDNFYGTVDLLFCFGISARLTVNKYP